MTALGEPNLVAIAFFLGFIALSLGITGLGVAAHAHAPTTSTRRAAASPRFRTDWRWPATT